MIHKRINNKTIKVMRGESIFLSLCGEEGRLSYFWNIVNCPECLKHKPEHEAYKESRPAIRKKNIKDKQIFPKPDIEKLIKYRKQHDI